MRDVHIVVVHVRGVPLLLAHLCEDSLEQDITLLECRRARETVSMDGAGHNLDAVKTEIGHAAVVQDL